MQNIEGNFWHQTAIILWSSRRRRSTRRPVLRNTALQGHRKGVGDGCEPGLCVRR